MQPYLFQFVSELLRRQSGLALTEDKIYLVESRLQPLAREYGMECVEELLVHLQRTQERRLTHDVVQAMTTNETMFFRDHKPFERFRSLILPALAKANRRDIRIWSAACATGQEPYTIAMCMQEEAANYPGLRSDIFATDLCEKALEKARKALYSQFEVQRGMQIQLLIKYFRQCEGNQWQINEATRSMVSFAQHNLLDDPARHGPFDVVFCRNVLIYFDEETKRDVLARIVSVLRPPGFVLLGSAETVLGLSDRLTMLPDAPGIYTLKN